MSRHYVLHVCDHDENSMIAINCSDVNTARDLCELFKLGIFDEDIDPDHASGWAKVLDQEFNELHDHHGILSNVMEERRMDYIKRAVPEQYRSYDDGYWMTVDDMM